MNKYLFYIKKYFSLNVENINESFEVEISKYSHNFKDFTKFSLFKEIFYCYKYFYPLVFAIIFYSCLTFLTPFFFKEFLERIQNISDTNLIPTIKLIVSILLSYLVINIIFYYSFKLALEVRRNVSKYLLLFLENNSKIETGILVSLYGQEISKIQSAAQSFPLILLSGLISIISCSFLIYLNGINSLFSIAILLISIYFTKKISKWNSRVSNDLNFKTQNRVESVSDIYSKIYSIILSGLAKNALKIIFNKRNEEEFFIKTRINSVTVLNLFIQMIPIFLSFSVILPDLIANGRVRADVVFPSLLLIGTIRSAFSSLPDLISEFIFGHSSSKRLNLLNFNGEKVNFSDKNTQNIYSKIKNKVSIYQVKNDCDVQNLANALSKYSSVIYLTEKSWVFKGSILENICLTKETVDSDRLNKAISISCLEKDISTMVDGLESLIEQDGTNLSGGQRQRICLARSIYDNANVIIAENTFSALDENTKNLVIDSCLQEGWAGRTIIIIDHNEELNKYANMSFSLNEGSFQFKEIVSNSHIHTHKKLSNDKTLEKITHTIIPLNSLLPKVIFIQNNFVSTIKKLAKYKSFLPMLILAFILACSKDIIILISEILLSNTTSVNGNALLQVNIILAFLLLFVAILFSFFSIKIILKICFKSSNILFRNLINLSLQRKIGETDSLDSYLSATIYDQKVMDQSLGQKIVGLLFSTSSLLAVMIFVSIIAPLFLPCLLLIFAFMNYLCLNYRRLVRSLSYAVSQSNGLAMAQITEYQNGSSYLKFRGIHKLWFQQRLIPSFVKIELLSELLQKTERLYSFRIEFLGTVAFVIFALIIANSNHQYSQVTLALILTYAASAITLSGRTARMLADFDRDIISLNKILDLLKEKSKIVTEKAEIQTDFSIQVQNMSFKYEKNPRSSVIIQSLSIPHCEKLAIVGRTGAGKSTFVKLVSGTLVPTTGFVKVGNIDTHNISHEHYDSYFKYIPQERFLLPGKLKYSFFSDEVSKEELKNIFTALELEPSVFKELDMNSSLYDNKINPNLLIASIIASKAKIVILDEPTSSYNQTESIEFIEKLIKHTNGKTIIMITHNPELSKLFTRVLYL